MIIVCETIIQQSFLLCQFAAYGNFVFSKIVKELTINAQYIISYLKNNIFKTPTLI